jgi:hypothetical protein
MRERRMPGGLEQTERAASSFFFIQFLFFKKREKKMPGGLEQSARPDS